MCETVAEVLMMEKMRGQPVLGAMRLWALATRALTQSSTTARTVGSLLPVRIE